MGDWTWDEDDVRDLRGLPHGQDRWGERRDNGDEAWNLWKAQERAASVRATWPAWMVGVDLAVEDRR